MSKGRRRPPTAEELELWAKVTETVTPFDQGRSPVSDEPPLPPAPCAEKNGAKKTPLPAAAAPPKPTPAKPAPTLSLMDRRTRSRLSRGVTSIDMRIDLHGLTQGAAETRVKRFLHDAQADGARVVLVITGKGTADGGDRGVLRRMVPQWLSAADMRAVVVGFEEASRSHGGAGALYVRVRRLR
jgi:DNA-nicking Smr family endonuclease